MKVCLCFIFSFVLSLSLVSVSIAADEKLHYIGVNIGNQNTSYQRMKKRLFYRLHRKLLKNNKVNKSSRKDAIKGEKQIWAKYRRQIGKLKRRNTPKVIVNVKDKSSDIVLVLSAYERTNWILNSEADNIKKIYLTGFSAHKLTSKKKYNVERCTNKNKCKYAFNFYRNDSDISYNYDRLQEKCTDEVVEFPKFYVDGVNNLLLLTGLSPESMQGAYTAETFNINDNTSGDLLNDDNPLGFCYENADGDLEYLDFS